MSVRRCSCPTRDDWRVVTRLGNYSAFNGYRFQPSDYSSVECEACHAVWRTKAAYVRDLPDTGRTLGYRDVESGGKGTRTVVAPLTVGRRSILEPYKEPLKCAACGKPGDIVRGPLTASGLGRIYHRDLPECA